MNWRASASPMNAPESNLWNIRQGIIRTHMRNIQTRDTVTFKNHAVHERRSDFVDCRR